GRALRHRHADRPGGGAAPVRGPGSADRLAAAVEGAAVPSAAPPRQPQVRLGAEPPRAAAAGPALPPAGRSLIAPEPLWLASFTPILPEDPSMAPTIEK